VYFNNELQIYRSDPAFIKDRSEKFTQYSVSVREDFRMTGIVCIIYLLQGLSAGPICVAGLVWDLRFVCAAFQRLRHT